MSDMGEKVFLTLCIIVTILVAITPAHCEELAAPGQTSGIVALTAQESLELDPEAVSRVERYILSFLRVMKHDIRWSRAPAVARIIVARAQAHSVDPLLVAVVVQHESSFWESKPGRARDPLLGKKGEKGLMQVWGAAAVGCDLSTSEGQVDCGARWLSSRLDKAGGDTLQGLMLYQGASCSDAAKPCGPKIRLAAYEAAKKK